MQNAREKNFARPTQYFRGRRYLRYVVRLPFESKPLVLALRASAMSVNRILIASPSSPIETSVPSSRDGRSGGFLFPLFPLSHIYSLRRPRPTRPRPTSLIVTQERKKMGQEGKMKGGALFGRSLREVTKWSFSRSSLARACASTRSPVFSSTATTSFCRREKRNRRHAD